MTGRQRHAIDAVPRRADGSVDVDRVVLALTAGARPPLLLESVPGTPHTGRYSYVVAQSDGELTWSTTAHVRRGSLADLPERDDPFAAIDDACRLLGLGPDAPRDPADPPFTGGLVGAFSYDLGRAIERIATTATVDRHHPDLHLVVATAVLVIDHVDESVTLHLTGGATVDAVASISTRLGDAPACPPLPRATTDGSARSSLPRDRYLAAFEHVMEHIAAGDTFQVNLTQRISAEWADDLHALYRSLRAASPAPYGAIVPTPDGGGLASISPETFLHADGRGVTTRPIKGTRPRDDDPVRDAAAGRELEASEKDRAENVMVVDMERNDLGRVCRPGSVTVPQLLRTEAHPTVWHLVSTVSGELADGVGWADLLRATFPCGSVTGTPKVRAMQIIEELEPVRRGWYCGAIGFLGAGTMSTSVAIRSATLSPDGVVDYGAGGGIVADSVADAEWQESLDKAAAFLSAVGATLA